MEDNYYDRIHEIFLKYSTIHKVYDEYMSRYLPSTLQRIQPSCSKTQYNVLSIGSGNGLMDQIILKYLIEDFNKIGNQNEIKIVNTAVEPHSFSLQQYRDLIQNRAASNQTFPKQKLVFEFEEKSFDDYARSNHEERRYDMIHAIQSFHWVDDVSSSLRYCYENELKSKGFIVLGQGNDGNLFSDILEITQNKNIGKRQKSERFAELANKMNFEFESIKLSYTIDISKIFDEYSEEGNLLLDFLTFESNFRRKNDKKLVDKILQYLRENSTEDKDGKVLVTSGDELVFIYKL